ncbi:hypothetical protein [Amphritea sp.]|uniref:hypothetical protein n=1 Tax=Amphritea sp. TaxID=1872502 RepID=UPI003A944579
MSETNISLIHTITALKGASVSIRASLNALFALVHNFVKPDLTVQVIFSVVFNPIAKPVIADRGDRVATGLILYKPNTFVNKSALLIKKGDVARFNNAIDRFNSRLSCQTIVLPTNDSDPRVKRRGFECAAAIRWRSGCTAWLSA